MKGINNLIYNKGKYENTHELIRSNKILNFYELNFLIIMC